MMIEKDLFTIAAVLESVSTVLQDKFVEFGIKLENEYDWEAEMNKILGAKGIRDWQDKEDIKSWLMEDIFVRGNTYGDQFLRKHPEGYTDRDFVNYFRMTMSMRVIDFLRGLYAKKKKFFSEIEKEEKKIEDVFEDVGEKGKEELRDFMIDLRERIEKERPEIQKTFKMVEEGYMGKEIAEALGVTPAAVSGYMIKIRELAEKISKSVLVAPVWKLIRFGFLVGRVVSKFSALAQPLEMRRDLIPGDAERYHEEWYKPLEKIPGIV